MKANRFNPSDFHMIVDRKCNIFEDNYLKPLLRSKILLMCNFSPLKLLKKILDRQIEVENEIRRKKHLVTNYGVYFICPSRASYTFKVRISFWSLAKWESDDVFQNQIIEVYVVWSQKRNLGWTPKVIFVMAFFDIRANRA